MPASMATGVLRRDSAKRKSRFSRYINERIDGESADAHSVAIENGELYVICVVSSRSDHGLPVRIVAVNCIHIAACVLNRLGDGLQLVASTSTTIVTSMTAMGDLVATH